MLLSSELVSLFLLQTLLYLIGLSHVEAKLDFKFKCGLCRAIVKETNWEVNQIDPEKTIVVGGYRVNPDGTQNIKTKKYARSESHLEEVMENVCNNLEDYGGVNNEDGTVELVRFRGKDGSTLDTDDLKITKDYGSALRYQCQTFLENHEEDVIDLLQREDLEDYENNICGEATSSCSETELSKPVRELPVKPEEPEETVTEDEDEDGEDVTDEVESNLPSEEEEQDPPNSFDATERIEL